MFRFGIEQKIFNIGRIKIGGQPGEYPTAIAGTMFYDGDKIVSNPVQGIFDRDAAEALIRRQEELSEKTGNPHLVDVVGSTPEAITKYIDFVADVTRAPILVDSLSVEVRIKGCKHAVEVGLRDRTVYNSITPLVTEQEILLIRETGIDTAIILAFSSGEHFQPERKLRLLEGGAEEEGLLHKAERAGIRKILIDTSVIDIASIAYAGSSIKLIKERLGLPAGCAPCNSIDTWNRVDEFGEHSRKTCIAGLAIIIQCVGGNFILYGPIKRAGIVFPACAMIDAITTYNAKTKGYEPEDKNSPLYKIF
ncbi:MAG: tetrahydromethanopterin S-methyltransferase subunit H [Candidatus Bathyarchaeia archaeon]